MGQIIKGCDLTLMYSVLDICGLNAISRRIIGNAAAAIAGMARVATEKGAGDSDRPLVAVTAFGVTTQAVQVARARLEERGCSVLVFHATGSGGESLEALFRAGFIRGGLGLTTTEVAVVLGGGEMIAGSPCNPAGSGTSLPRVHSTRGPACGTSRP